MSAQETLNFDGPPSFGPIYKKIFLTRRPGYRPDTALPTLVARFDGVTPDIGNVAKYREVCDWPGDDTLPILYPHVLTSSLHLSLMTHPGFPLSMMGAVHARNHVLQQRAIQRDEALSAEAALSGWRVVKQGIETNVTTRITAGEETVWESASVYLVRGKHANPEDAPESAKLDALEGGDLETGWPVPLGTGRRYAAVCGDYNPIHISKWLAKLFGFKREIAHGMWSAAKCCAALPAPPDGPQRIDLLFKGPVFMQSKVALKAETSGDARRFDLFCGSNPRPTIQGLWAAAEPGTTLTL